MLVILLLVCNHFLQQNLNFLSTSISRPRVLIWTHPCMSLSQFCRTQVWTKVKGLTKNQPKMFKGAFISQGFFLKKDYAWEHQWKCWKCLLSVKCCMPGADGWVSVWIQAQTWANQIDSPWRSITLLISLTERGKGHVVRPCGKTLEGKGLHPFYHLLHLLCSCSQAGESSPIKAAQSKTE